MCKDVVVCELEHYEWKVHNAHLIPKALHTHVKTTDDIERRVRILDYFETWCAGRVLSIDRHYAKKILNALLISQGQTNKEKAQISLAFRCTSLCESYWVRFSEYDNTQWADVSLRSQSLGNCSKIT